MESGDEIDVVVEQIGGAFWKKSLEKMSIYKELIVITIEVNIE